MRELIESLGGHLGEVESKKDDIEDEEWFKDFEAAQAKEKKAFGKFAQKVKRAMRSKGVYEVKSQFESQGGKIIIHKSTRPGVAYQVTQIDNRGPSGHHDSHDLNDAIKEAWLDVSRAEKRKFR